MMENKNSFLSPQRREDRGDNLFALAVRGRQSKRFAFFLSVSPDRKK
jgi:hypothetical protein